MKKIISMALALFLLFSMLPVTQAHAAMQTQDPGDGYYVRIRYAGNNRYVDIPSEGINKNGTQLQLWDYVCGNKNQIYILKNTGNGWQIISLQSGKVVEVRNSSHDNYAQIAQWAQHSMKCALWDIRKNNDGTVSFRNKESGLYLNVSGGGDAGNATKLIQYYDDGTVAMRFFIEVVHDGSNASSHANTAYVKTSNPNSRLKMRANASSQSSVIGYIPYGTKVVVHDVMNGYAKVTSNGKEGYVPASYLKNTKPSNSVTANESGVTYTYLTFKLDTSNLSSWITSFMKAQSKADGAIVEIKVNSYKSMKITEPLHGPAYNGKSPTKTTTISMPYRITLKVHKHERVMAYGRSVKYADGCIITSYSCNCGYFSDILAWEIPLPDPAEFTCKQICDTIKIQSQQSYWINNMK